MRCMLKTCHFKKVEAKSSVLVQGCVCHYTTFLLLQCSRNVELAEVVWARDQHGSILNLKESVIKDRGD